MVKKDFDVVKVEDGVHELGSECRRRIRERAAINGFHLYAISFPGSSPSNLVNACAAVRIHLLHSVFSAKSPIAMS